MSLSVFAWAVSKETKLPIDTGSFVLRSRGMLLLVGRPGMGNGYRKLQLAIVSIPRQSVNDGNSLSSFETLVSHALATSEMKAKRN